MASSSSGTCSQNSVSFKHLTTNFGNIPEEINPLIASFAKSHIDSFNYILSEGLVRAVQDITPVEFSLVNGTRISIAFKDATILNPCVNSQSGSTDLRQFPSECRLRRTTYKSKLQVKITWSIDDRVQPMIERKMGEIPVMVKSNCCTLKDMKPKELVAHGEEEEEFGGYFIVNGNEKLIRMLIIQKRNYPIAMKRSTWKGRGKLFSDIGIAIRCVKPDFSASAMVLHYLTNGTAKLMFIYRREMFFVPIVLLLKALTNYSDRDIYNALTMERETDSHYKGCIANMLRQVQEEGLFTRSQALSYIGERFRNKLYLADWYTDEENAVFLLKELVCVHLESNIDKFNLLVFMTKKLFAAVKGECEIENADNLSNHEVLLSGHLYLMVLKEKLSYWLSMVKTYSMRKSTDVGESFRMTLLNLSQIMKKPAAVTRSMEYLLATGNLVSKTGLALMQKSGFAIIADKLNYLRYVSHFRSIHRGAFFTEMRTTSVRKLLPESWGFVCPVHTPDGAPCGLLNHLTADCQVVVVQADIHALPNLLCSLGMTPLKNTSAAFFKDSYTVILDGRLLGNVTKDLAPIVASRLRQLKATEDIRVPEYLEICLVPITGRASQYPGLFLFSTPSRLMRPVRNLSTNTTEFIGVFEQVYLNISVIPSEVYPDVTTHVELQEASILSFSASLIPLSDFNQSPRNMYQCQMAKQTMGTPATALKYRGDNKLYRILTPQSPLFRNAAYNHYNLDNYPLGTNAIVAVISFTGYDMEDAMILNKASFERGFAHGVIYKNEIVDLTSNGRVFSVFFGRNSENDKVDQRLGTDGLPPVGTFLNHGDPFYSTFNINTGQQEVHYYKSMEPAYIEDILLLGSDSGKAELQKVCFRFRIPRNPIIGDKFASRHGQKGICSQKWPQENMPFTESGMTPDIIFNPHGFPSRMTIGMMIESMAGKSTCLHGIPHDASPFQFSEDDPAADYFGKLLEAAGYNYYGTERMYSGVDGRELNADIFFGVVYYQRLRHMVADKFQVRTTGPVDTLSKQPVKGRKKAGGIRFGEMERDSLLAHGVSFLLQDRLFVCSDKALVHNGKRFCDMLSCRIIKFSKGSFPIGLKSLQHDLDNKKLHLETHKMKFFLSRLCCRFNQDHICSKCGGLLCTIAVPPTGGKAADKTYRWKCLICDTGDHVELIYLPFVFRYLAAELASINVKLTLSIE